MRLGCQLTRVDPANIPQKSLPNPRNLRPKPDLRRQDVRRIIVLVELKPEFHKTAKRKFEEDTNMMFRCNREKQSTRADG